MSPHALRPFEDPVWHEDISAMLRRRSSNRRDIRAALLEGLDLARVGDALELGCGFGFVSEAVAALLAPETSFTGVDACAANAAPFIRRVRAGGCRPVFRHLRIEDHLPWPGGTFDLVLCSWCLYFFPGILPEIARVLRPDGVLLAITHGETAFSGLLEVAGLGARGHEPEALLRRFSAQNGAALLDPHFGRVERVDYPNRLHFGPEDAGELLAYLAFKLPVLLADPPPGRDLPPGIEVAARRVLLTRREVWVEKDDACFRCWEPR